MCVIHVKIVDTENCCGEKDSISENAPKGPFPECKLFVAGDQLLDMLRKGPI